MEGCVFRGAGVKMGEVREGLGGGGGGGAGGGGGTCTVVAIFGCAEMGTVERFVCMPATVLAP